MEQRDYLQKQIDRLGQFMEVLINKVINSKNAEKPQETVAEAERAMNEAFHFSVGERVHLSDDDFLKKLLKDERLNNTELLELFADLITETGRVHQATNDRETAEIYFLKALIVYQQVDRQSNDFSLERSAKIQKVKNCL